MYWWNSLKYKTSTFATMFLAYTTMTCLMLQNDKNTKKKLTNDKYYLVECWKILTSYKSLSDNNTVWIVGNQDGSECEENLADYNYYDRGFSSHKEALFCQVLQNSIEDRMMSWNETQLECNEHQLLLIKRIKDFLAGRKRVT